LRNIGVALVVLLGAFASAATAQEPTESTRVDDVVVVGDAPRAARAFVEEVGDAPAGARLARWNAPVCVGVIGVQDDRAQAIAGRISEVATELGVETARPGCTPNVVIIFTDDGDEMARTLVSEDRGRFRLGIDSSSPSLAALNRFTRGGAPVRWWHTAVPVNADTRQLAARYRGGSPPGADALARGGAASDTASRGATRLRSAVRYDLNSVTIIVDLTRIEGAIWPALEDYFVMLALAQIDPEADVRARDTILNLFHGQSDIEGLSEWDAAYLIGLYRAREDAVSASAQEGQIAREVQGARRDLREEED
jgi:hypothetical protein